MLLPTLILYGTLAACVIVTAWMVKQYDLYRREPWWFLVIATAVGAAAMSAAGYAQEAVITEIGNRRGTITDPQLALLAASFEESAKLIAVVVIALCARKHFDDPLDGLIYGSFVGLGTALEESVHVLNTSALSPHLPPQEPVRLAGHLVMGGIGSFGLGLLRMPTRRWRLQAVWAIPVCFVLAFTLHMFWDIAAFDAAVVYRATGELDTWHTALPVGLMVGGMVAYRGLAAWGAILTRYTLQVCDVSTKRCPPPLPPFPEDRAA